ncbi:hypothetical protein [Halobacteriovorax sp. HLS]|uniref:hypothetical protein n=1 Tax=Halobacteriovorax sp. HLS TaxID=2234000 RepID=UPI000FD77652|nr:hypothetical protein [Halobacteriovorax sp. HLS]
MLSLIFTILINLTFSLEIKTLELQCSQGKANSCFDVAYGYSLKGDQVRPIQFFEKGCEFKDGKSCYALYKINKKLKQKMEEEKFLDFSCDYEFAKGCLALSKKKFKQSEFLLGLEKLKKACVLKDKASCDFLREKESYFSRVVRSSEKELKKEELEHQKIYLKELNSRITSRIKLCTEKNDQNCALVAKDYLFLANIKEARKWSEISCKNQDPKGCLILGEVEQKEGKEEFPSFMKACELKSSLGCYRYAQSIEVKNLAKAMSFYKESCDSAQAPIVESCQKYAIYNKGNPIFYKRYLGRVCELDKSLCKK